MVQRVRRVQRVRLARRARRATRAKLVPLVLMVPLVPLVLMGSHRNRSGMTWLHESKHSNRLVAARNRSCTVTIGPYPFQ